MKTDSPHSFISSWDAILSHARPFIHYYSVHILFCAHIRICWVWEWPRCTCTFTPTAATDWINADYFDWLDTVSEPCSSLFQHIFYLPRMCYQTDEDVFINCSVLSSQGFCREGSPAPRVTDGAPSPNILTVSTTRKSNPPNCENIICSSSFLHFNNVRMIRSLTDTHPRPSGRRICWNLYFAVAAVVAVAVAVAAAVVAAAARRRGRTGSGRGTGAAGPCWSPVPRCCWSDRPLWTRTQGRTRLGSGFRMVINGRISLLVIFRHPLTHPPPFSFTVWCIKKRWCWKYVHTQQFSGHMSGCSLRHH